MWKNAANQLTILYYCIMIIFEYVIKNVKKIYLHDLRYTIESIKILSQYNK